MRRRTELPSPVPVKPRDGITLPASFVVTVSHAGTEVQVGRPADNDILTVTDLALILKCKESSIYNLTRRRGRTRYDNPVPVLRLPMGLRFRRSSVLAWLKSQEQRG
jgi:predicted DNA-binding transcriptional regulator AlpA